MLTRNVRKALKSGWALGVVGVAAIGFSLGLLYSSMTGEPTVAQTPPGPPPDLPTPIGTPSPDMMPKPAQPPQFYSSASSTTTDASATSTSKHPKELAEFFASKEFEDLQAEIRRQRSTEWGFSEDGMVKYTENVGPHTKGTKLKNLQLPDDVWVGDVMWDISLCFGENPQCPGVPVYKLRSGESPRSFVWVGPDLKIIGPEFINWNENADLDAFSFLTDQNDGPDGDDEE